MLKQTNSLSFSLYAGCDGGMGAVPEVLALFRAHLLLGGHHAATASGGEEIPDNGPYLEEDHGKRPPGPQGQLLVLLAQAMTHHTHTNVHTVCVQYVSMLKIIPTQSCTYA